MAIMCAVILGAILILAIMGGVCVRISIQSSRVEYPAVALAIGMIIGVLTGCAVFQISKFTDWLMFVALAVVAVFVGMIIGGKLVVAAWHNS